MNAGRTSNSLARRGFSFTEILFAIMILGIGFILVASMFPVAIKQADTSKSETVGAQLARTGVSFVQQMGSTSFYQISPTAVPAGDKLCVLRPTVQFPGTHLFTDQDLYNAIKPGSAVDPTNALPPYTVPGTYIVPGEVWDFMPISPTGFGAEPVAAVASGSGSVPTSTNLSALLCSMISENMVQTADPKYGWVAFYKRDMIETVIAPPGGAITRSLAYAPSAQIIVVAVADRNATSYTTSINPSGTPALDVPAVPSSPTPPAVVTQPPSLQASRSAPGSPATIIPPDANSLDATISFSDPIQNQRADEGAFVIVAADAQGTMPLSSPFHGLLNGRIYRLGAFDAGSSQWKFAPGYGPSTSDITAMAGHNRFSVYLIGRGLNPDGSTPVYSGLAQDVAAYSTFVSCPIN
ncbi:MAG TPA: prepilin-type N-terminal cleavage/methylation domain-containing protein [Tepidisphaeraceae bacterium]|jgi:prepilin-type N-terminal cleavage/methylation domain-containing protein|nr:prepilin-type N-terminal cleavage/methylation domain-containing protein [Tepidisphaeraceae bacterium]